MPHILAFAGSSRAGSHNQRILRIAMAAAEAAGATVEYIDLRALDLPIYDGDIEAEGSPSGVKTFHDAIDRADGFLIASPEYNSGYSALLKNSLDWASRPTADRKMLQGIGGKKAALMSASPSPLGGVRGLPSFREVLLNIGVTVVPTTAFVGGVRDTSYTDAGDLTDEKLQARVQSVGKALAAALS